MYAGIPVDFLGQMLKVLKRDRQCSTCKNFTVVNGPGRGTKKEIKSGNKLSPQLSACSTALGC